MTFCARAGDMLAATAMIAAQSFVFMDFPRATVSVKPGSGRAVPATLR
jgi:hypothetical protein